MASLARIRRLIEVMQCLIQPVDRSAHHELKCKRRTGLPVRNEAGPALGLAAYWPTTRSRNGAALIFRYVDSCTTKLR